MDAGINEDDDQKRLIQAPIIGERGATLAKFLTLGMGCTWHDTNSLLETGVDAWIELRDPTTGVMLNLWIAAQSKAHEGPFPGEDDTSFTFEFPRRDLAYWLKGNMPVILIVSRPASKESWWRAISPDIKQASGEMITLTINKQRDEYGPRCYEALRALADKRVDIVEPVEEPVEQQQITSTGLELPFRAIGGPSLVPAIPIRLSGVAKTFAVLALIDSGADMSVLPYEFANVLGIDLSTCDQTSVQVASGTSSMYVCPSGITAEAFGVSFQLNGVFASTGIPLLGRLDFFSRFLVEIDQRNHKFKLRPYNNDDDV
jgi:hypothetical protein